MPTSDTWPMLHIGNFADMDVDNNNLAEGAGNLVGQTFGSAGSPLFADKTDVTYTDPNDDGDYYEFNPTRPESLDDGLSYDLGGGVINSQIDSLIDYDVTVNFHDGTPSETLTITVVQSTNGDVFVYPRPSSGGTNFNTNLIQSITFDSISFDSYSKEFYNYNDGFDFAACFTPGTAILTDAGERNVEELRVGDQVITYRGSVGTIRWIFSKTFPISKEMCPVNISASALGEGIPQVDLVVSQQHRVLIRSKIVSRVVGSDEALIPAKCLLSLDGVELIENLKRVTYTHFMTDRHSIVYSIGCPTESFFPGSFALRSLNKKSLDEIKLIFPEIEIGSPPISPARKLLSRRIGEKIVERHKKNGKQLIDSLAVDLTVLHESPKLSIEVPLVS